jgi:hypothetical protein
MKVTSGRMIASARQENDTSSLEPESFVDLAITETNPEVREVVQTARGCCVGHQGKIVFRQIEDTMKNIAIVLIAVLFSTALVVDAHAQGDHFNGIGSPSTTPVRRVFLNVTGDPKLAHRLLSFLDLEFEDTGIQLMNTEANADAEVDSEVNAEIENQDLGIGVMRLSSTANGKTETTSSCESLGTPADGEFFSSSTDGLATQLREKHPDAKTVKLDTASDTAASKVFSYQLPNALKASSFTIVGESGTPDLTLRIDLMREKVPIEEHVIKYKVKVNLRNGSRLFSSDGSGVISARATSVPELCPGRVTDLDWLSRSDTLFQVAESIVKQLRINNRRAENTKK